MITSEQIRAARALLRWDQAAVASAASLSTPTIKRLEKMSGPINANTSTEAALRRAFNEGGVLFIDENGEGPGVRLRKGR